MVLSVGSPSGAVAAREGVVAEEALACTARVVAAGDMNSLPANRATGSLAQRLHPHVVAVLGDLAYPNGSRADFLRAYDPTGWGALKARTRPVPGNHEYRTPGAGGYYSYFGQPARYYAYTVGCGWRGYALNSEIDIAAQARWLRADLRAHPGVNVLAYWHKPRYSSGTHHGNDPRMQPFWDALAGRAGVVLNGHEHHYERFSAIGRMREFVVGTGGSSAYPFKAVPAAGSQKRIRGAPGVLLLTLSNGRYAWSFRNVRNTVLDSGAGG